MSDLYEFQAMAPEKLALRPREAAKALSIGERLLWQLTKDGKIPCVRVGGEKRHTILYPVAELQAWLAREANANLAADVQQPVN
jgi:excisionase family DNA binding protein